jgi:penicillin-binding protein 1A
MRRLLLVASGFGLGLLSAFASALAVHTWVVRDLPDLGRLEDYRPPLATLVVDREGRPIGEFFEERRRLVPLDAVPPQVIRAFLAIEDAGFFEHCGLDFAALARAAWVNLRAGGEIRQGGSTITQQLAKSLLLDSDRTLRRKLRDMLLALRIEARFSKQRILEIYLNQIYFGAGAYGLAEAARSYFDKDVAELSLAEAALLAGLPKAPSAFSPLRRPERSEARRIWVLARMRELGWIDAATEREAVAERPAIVRGANPVPSVPATTHFVEEVRRDLYARLGADTVLRGGLRVETTLDAGLEAAAREALRRGIDAAERRRGRAPGSRSGPATEGALVALDVASGDVLALVGGYDFAASEFDRAVQARRQPGSAFKPFVYGAALAAGFRPDGPLYDYQVDRALPGRSQHWRPRNYSETLRGEVPMVEAFARSLNNASIRLLEEVGVSRAIAFARRAGIRSPLGRHLSLALGTSEVTLLELTSAYATFARGGRTPRPRYVTRVLDREGRELLRDLVLGGETPAAAGLSPVDAYLVTHLLRSSVELWYGTGRPAAELGRPVAGKTGSTNGYRDAWFIGFTPDLVTGVWVGRDDHGPLGRRETGARAALPIWSEFMQAAHASRPTRDFEVPAGVEFAALDPETGELRRSTRPAPGIAPYAQGRPLRESRYVPPPLPEVERIDLASEAAEPLPPVGAAPPLSAP